MEEAGSGAGEAPKPELALIDPHMLDEKVKQAQRMPEDKDKLRLIGNLVTQFVVTPQQAIRLAKTCTYFGNTVEACAKLLDCTSDHDNFVHDALELCQFPEDRVAMCAMLDVEFIPLPEKKGERPKPKRKTLASGFGATGGKLAGW